MTNEMIIQIAMEQSAIDSNCKVEDFKQFQNVVTVSKENVNARRYLKLPHICDLTSYGDNIVATVDEKYIDIVSKHLTCMSLMMHFKKTVIEFVLWRNIFSLMLMI